MRARGYHLVLALLSVAPHVRASDTPADPSHSLRFRQALPRPSFGGTHHRLRGGASSGKPIKQTDPALKPAYAAYVVAWAVLPTLLRLAVRSAARQESQLPADAVLLHGVVCRLRGAKDELLALEV